MTIKLHDPEERPETTAPPPLAAPTRRRPRRSIPRCRCGCGKAARWPQDGGPLFYSREHGYLVAVKAIRQGKKA